MLKTWLRQRMSLPEIDLQAEASPYLKHLHGIVLNAGAGHRPLRTGLPTLQLDFDETAPVDVLADLHYLPLKDACIDSVISIAVLEHTRLPWECCREFWRVLKPGGTAVICVPFLQPEHAAPHDFFRYTVYGVTAMLEWAGFNVVLVERLGRQHRGLAWILLDMYRGRRLLRWLVCPLAAAIARRARTGDLPPQSVYTGLYAIARKAGDAAGSSNVLPQDGKWFYPLLADPVSKVPLVEQPAGELASPSRVYSHKGMILDLRPQDGLSQDAKSRWGRGRA